MFKTDSKEMWLNEVEPFIMDEIRIKAQSDEELTRSLEKIVNSVNSDISRDQNFAHRLEVIARVINSNSYYADGAMRRASAEEVALVRQLAEKLSALYKVARYDLKKDEEVKEDVGHERLPNPKNVDVADLYKPINPNAVSL